MKRTSFFQTINKYNKRGENANRMHKLHASGYLLILNTMLCDKIRKKFGFKPREFELTTLTTLLISYIKETGNTQRVEEFFFNNGICRATYIRHRQIGTHLGLYIQNQDRTYTITDKGHEIITFACRVVIRDVGVLRCLLDEVINGNQELFT